MQLSGTIVTLIATLGVFVALPRPCVQGTSPGTAAAPARSDFDHAHTLWSEILRAHVQGDRFDYAALKAAPAKLTSYLEQLHLVTKEQLSGWTREQRFAFWINAYNAHTIQKVVDHYPLKSIKDLSGLLSSVFDDEFIPMKPFHPDGADDKLSLNDIEHGILRKQFEDARVHAAINCASYSCPPLLGEAFVATRLDAQLTAQMRAFVVDAKRNVYDRAKERMQISEIFKWFAEDFERDAESVREYLVRYGPPEDAAFFREAKLAYSDYVWKLNDVEAKKG